MFKSCVKKLVKCRLTGGLDAEELGMEMKRIFRLPVIAPCEGCSPVPAEWLRRGHCELPCQHWCWLPFGTLPCQPPTDKMEPHPCLSSTKTGHPSASVSY